MLLSPSVSVYLKTTETCNLNCAHCFTSGTNGKKGYFNPKKIISFFKRLQEAYPWVTSVRYLFHGGEPLLAPIDLLYEAHDGLKDIFPHTSFGLQTNLVYPLSPEKKRFFSDIIHPYGFGTSWDYDIRFGSTSTLDRSRVKAQQLELWESNVRELLRDGHFMTLMVSISKKLIEEMEPREVIEYAAGLGIQNILFERITSDGNAKENSEILPANSLQDEWLHRMFIQTLDNNLQNKINNLFLSELVEAFVNHRHVGNRCRTCEQSLMTINADGSIAGCPNTAPQDFWGHIDLPIEESIKSTKRMQLITCEAFERNPVCYTCSAFEYCNSDCNKLRWDDSYCAAPKKIWKHMMEKNQLSAYRKLFLTESHQVPHGI